MQAEQRDAAHQGVQLHVVSNLTGGLRDSGPRMQQQVGKGATPCQVVLPGLHGLASLFKACGAGEHSERCNAGGGAASILLEPDDCPCRPSPCPTASVHLRQCPSAPAPPPAPFLTCSAKALSPSNSISSTGIL